MGKITLEHDEWFLDIIKNYEKWKVNYTKAEQEGIALGEGGFQASASAFFEATTYFLTEKAAGRVGLIAEAEDIVTKKLEEAGIDIPESEKAYISKGLTTIAVSSAQIKGAQIDGLLEYISPEKNGPLQFDKGRKKISVSDGNAQKLELSYEYDSNTSELLIKNIRIIDPKGMTLPQIQETFAGTIISTVTPESLIFGLNYENYNGDINNYPFSFNTVIDNPIYFNTSFENGVKIQTGLLENGVVQKVRMENIDTKVVTEFRQNNVTNIVTETITDKDGNISTRKYDALTGDDVVNMSDNIGTIPSSEEFKQIQEKANKLLAELNEPTIGDETSQYILKKGQTISHIAAKLDGINSIDLLEYNGLTLEQAKSLPIGFDVKIPKDVSIIQGEKAPIKIFENHDGTKSAIIKDENNNTIKVDNVEISSDKTQMSYTFEDATHILKKSSTGLMYESEVSTENITVQYDSPNIDIKADTTFEEVSSLTKYTKEELKEFNLYEDDTISAGSNISTPLSKDILDGGYGNITHYTTNDGENIFIVPNEDGTSTTYGTFTDGFDNQASYEKNKNGSYSVNLSNEDGSTRMIIANSDGYSFDSYGLEDKVDIEYERLGNDELIVKSLYAKEDLDIESFSLNSSLNKEQIAFLNSIDNSGGKILQGQSIILPEGKMQYIDSAYGKVIIQKTTDGNSIFIVPNSDVTSTTYGTFTDGFENQVYCEKEVA
ncbi:LysM peptidoglycan-binding domain-containing protein [Arcobacter sp. CECT 8986]|uniref:LysM peptidoglycan-binding domain-containing protein n=1 Tax=Arcobacter sp. CECT 8986 TaxID=2044507 RepID=UPI001009A287|nr:LysM peptidoglycan-binding domain-containing protein [Arcobacter sp. CECT 8986]